MKHSLQERYYQLLTRYVAQPQQKHLAEAAELGRELGLADVPPEEFGELHEKAIEDLAPAFPDIEPLEVVRIVSTPMTEVLTAYGLAFRQRHARLGKGSEAALRESEERYRSLFEATVEAIIIHEHGKILDTNPSAETMFLCPRAEAVGRSVLDFTAVESREDVMQNIRAGKSTPYEALCLRRDGKTFYGEICARNIVYLGRRVRAIAVRDITGRKQAEAVLKQRVQELNSLNTLSRHVSANLPLDRVVQAAIEGIATAIAPDLVLIFLKKGEKLVLQGAGPSNAKIKHKQTPIHRVGECLCGLAAKNGKPMYSENIHADPRCTWEECKKAGVRSFAALPLRSGDTILGVLGLASKVERDFGQQADFLETLSNDVATGLQNALLYEQVRRHAKELEERVAERTAELKLANERLQEADRLKSIFLASMSHELRTPLNSIIGFTGIILQGMAGKINAEQKKQLTMVKSGANHLLSLINDLLDVSKIESGEVEISLQKFRLHEVVREVVETFSPAVDKKGLKLFVDVPEEITLVSDKRRVKQVLMNLVSNGVKFTERGSIKISAGLSSPGMMQASVKDTGIGIKKANMNKLFKPFQQIDLSLTKRYEGTGLGLYLCKKLVALLAGEISATSHYGKGSEFTFSLPLKLEAAKHQTVMRNTSKIESGS
ncbi:MAG: ATP-binding protein [bacterium]